MKTFIISDEPDAPRHLAVTDISKNSVSLTWEPPRDDGGSKVMGYYVEKRTPYSARWSRVSKHLVKDTRFTYTNAQVGDEYEFRVCAENAAGVGKPSEPTQPITVKDPFGE